MEIGKGDCILLILSICLPSLFIWYLVIIHDYNYGIWLELIEHNYYLRLIIMTAGIFVIVSANQRAINKFKENWYYLLK